MKKTRKRRRLKKKPLIILALLLILVLNLNNINTLIISKTSGYDFKTVEVFLEKDIYDDIKEYEYSKTLEVILNTEHYNQNHLKDYINIDYIEKEKFIENINLLLEKGYTSKDINNINSILNIESINILINSNYIEDITNIITIDYFKENKLERYINYYQDKELDSETIVTYVNIGLDNEYYTNVIDVEDQKALDVLVNKYNKLQSNYVPENLKTLKSKYGSASLREDAAIAFEKMCDEAKKENIYIYGGSGYRSYNHQQNLYNNYVARDGKAEADTYSARAGHSEHQTGLAMDILNGRWSYIDEKDKEYTWLINNSYKYGFILRYLKGKEEITGYMYEPWHYRYVGVELATEIQKLNITYDEYVAKNS